MFVYVFLHIHLPVFAINYSMGLLSVCVCVGGCVFGPDIYFRL